MSEKIKRPILRTLANACTDLRSSGGRVLADNISRSGPNFRSWKLAAIAGALLYTDKLDGWLARKSNIPSTEYADKDSDADKEFYQLTMSAIGTATGDKRYLAYNALTDVRNNIIAAKRDELKAQGLDTTSRRLGKYKTTVQSIGMVADLSPIGEVYPRVVHTIHMSAIAMSALSGVSIYRDANMRLAELDSQIAGSEELAETEMQVSIL